MKLKLPEYVDVDEELTMKLVNNQTLSLNNAEVQELVDLLAALNCVDDLNDLWAWIDDLYSKLKLKTEPRKISLRDNVKFWEDEVKSQRKWIREHGGNLEGYIERYGDHGHEKCFGNGGSAIYKADADALLEKMEILKVWKEKLKKALDNQ